MQQEVHENGPG